MTFTIITPYQIGPDEIDAKNIATEPTYSGAATYALGDVVLGSDGRAFEYIGTPGSSHADPVTAGQTDWAWIGPPAYLRPFAIQIGIDQPRVINLVAENADSITYTISGLGAVLGIGFERLQAQSITLRVTSDGGTTGDVYNQTYNLPDLANIGGSFFNWLTLPINRERRYSLTNIYWPSSSTIEITITNTGGTAKVGAIVMGLAQLMGATLHRPSYSLESRSFESFDGIRASLVKRYPGGGVECEVKVPESGAAAARQVLEDLSGSAALFIASPGLSEWTVYGILEGRVQLTGETRNHSFLSMRVRGI